MKNDATRAALRLGLGFLAESQESDGSFPGESFQENGRTLSVKTVFDTAFILTSLTPVRSASAEQPDMITAALAFLDNERHENGAYNYWARSSSYVKKLAYPDDLDDTALAIASSIIYTGNEPSGDMLAPLVHLLTGAELAEGGPYNTWICNWRCDPRWQNCDLGVNANIAYMLSLLNIELPNLEAFFEQALVEGVLTSEYYPSPIILLYFIARSYKGKSRDRAIELILKYQTDDMDWGNSLLSALACSSLLRLKAEGVDYAKIIDTLLAAQLPDGSWPREILYLDPSTAHARWYHGSTALTTTCLLEAISLYQDRAQETPSAKSEPTQDRHIHTDAIIRSFIDDATLADPLFGIQAFTLSKKILANSLSHESMVLAFIWKDMLEDTTSLPPDETLILLGKANLAGWIGYTIMDAIVDGDTDGELAPFGIWAIRYLSRLYQEILSSEDYHCVDILLSGMEAALCHEHSNRLPQAFDITTYALPDRSILPTYHKSIGHALPALAVLMLSGERSDSPAYKHTLEFFMAYLAARQLNDDAHDVVDDITSGILTPIGHIVLSRIRTKNTDTKTKPLQLTEKNIILETFWYDAFDEVHGLIETHIESAKKSLEKLPSTDTTYCISLIAGLEYSQLTARKKRDSMITFLKYYGLGV